jgi:predicted N-acetyltransferase YhbS
MSLPTLPIIRPEAPEDERAIRDVTVAAFTSMPYADGNEHQIIEALRTRSALTLSLVAEIDGRIVGHIAFSPAYPADGSRGWFALGPVSVVPECQRSGIGSALVERGLDELTRTGAAGCILVGNPAYYGRFGFALAPDLAPPDQPVAFFQAKLLNGPAAKGPIRFHEAFGN